MRGKCKESDERRRFDAEYGGSKDGERKNKRKQRAEGQKKRGRRQRADSTFGGVDGWW